jgi:hypothetical protein
MSRTSGTFKGSSGDPKTFDEIAEEELGDIKDEDWVKRARMATL